jgi:hypothetical protein
MAVGILAEGWRPHTWLNYYSRIAVLSFLAISVIGVFAGSYNYFDALSVASAVLGSVFPASR